MRIIMIVLVCVIGAILFLYPASEVYACTQPPLPTPRPTNTADASGHIEPLPTNTPYPTPMSTGDWFASQVNAADVIVAGTVIEYSYSTLRMYAEKYYKGEGAALIEVVYYFNPCREYDLPRANDLIVAFLQNTPANEQVVWRTYKSNAAVTAGLINLTGSPKPATDAQSFPIVIIGFVMSLLVAGMLAWRKLLS